MGFRDYVRNLFLTKKPAQDSDDMELLETARTLLTPHADSAQRNYQSAQETTPLEPREKVTPRNRGDTYALSVPALQSSIVTPITTPPVTSLLEVDDLVYLKIMPWLPEKSQFALLFVLRGFRGFDLENKDHPAYYIDPEEKNYLEAKYRRATMLLLERYLPDIYLSLIFKSKDTVLEMLREKENSDIFENFKDFLILVKCSYINIPIPSSKKSVCFYAGRDYEAIQLPSYEADTVTPQREIAILAAAEQIGRALDRKDNTSLDMILDALCFSAGYCGNRATDFINYCMNWRILIMALCFSVNAGLIVVMVCYKFQTIGLFECVDFAKKYCDGMSCEDRFISGYCPSYKHPISCQDIDRVLSEFNERWSNDTLINACHFTCHILVEYITAAINSTNNGDVLFSSCENSFKNGLGLAVFMFGISIITLSTGLFLRALMMCNHTFDNLFFIPKNPRLGEWEKSPIKVTTTSCENKPPAWENFYATFRTLNIGREESNREKKVQCLKIHCNALHSLQKPGVLVVTS